MKKIIIFLFFLSFIQHVNAQIEITPFGGWLWTGAVRMYYYPDYWRDQHAKVGDMGNYGFRIGATVRPYTTAEFEWNYTSTNLTYRDWYGDRQSVDVSVNYYMLGGMRELQDGPTIPYGLFNIGLVNFKGKNLQYNDQITMLVAGLGFGVKHFVSDNVGIRLQGRLLFPMQFAGVSIGCGIGTGGGGCGTGVSSYSTIIQGDFTGGVILKFGGE